MTARKQRRAILILGAVTAILLLCVGLRFSRRGQSAPLIWQLTEESDAPAAPLPEDARIDLNAATQEELQALPGIGSVLAERIVARREELGPFRTEADVLAVNGVGEATLAKIAPYITFGDGQGDNQ